MSRFWQRQPGVLLTTRTPREPTVLPDGVTGWTRRRWVAVVTAVFVVQVVTLLLLGQRPRPVAPPLAPRGRVTLLSNKELVPSSLPTEALVDPADFALVGPRAFSADIWFRHPRFDRRLNEWQEPPRYLASTADPAGETAPAVALPRSFFSLREPPEPAASTVASRLLVDTNSTVRVEGLPAARTPRWQNTLPIWEHPDVLQASLVQVTVDEHGAVLTATLLASSGLATADQKALELARAVAFAPLPEALNTQIQWARLIFDWRTVAPGIPPK